MAKNTAQAKFVHICAGRKKGLCFSDSDKKIEEVWKHTKSYRKKPGYENVIIREAACLGICRDGPCISIIDENADETFHTLGAERHNVEEAKNLLDRFMDDYVIDTTPPTNKSENCGCGNCE